MLPATRVSTAKQGASGLGLEAQRKAVEDFLNGGSWKIQTSFTEVESGKRDDRPAIRACRAYGATLAIAKLDRLSRDAHFLLGLQKAGVKFVAADMPEANEMVVGIMACIAQGERKMISERTKAALKAPRHAVRRSAASCECAPTRIGRPPWRPGRPPRRLRRSILHQSPMRSSKQGSRRFVVLRKNWSPGEFRWLVAVPLGPPHRSRNEKNALRLGYSATGNCGRARFIRKTKAISSSAHLIGRTFARCVPAMTSSTPSGTRRGCCQRAFNSARFLKARLLRCQYPCRLPQR